jgi:hypothetical protein
VYVQCHYWYIKQGHVDVEVRVKYRHHTGARMCNQQQCSGPHNDTVVRLLDLIDDTDRCASACFKGWKGRERFGGQDREKKGLGRVREGREEVEKREVPKSPGCTKVQLASGQESP